MLGLYLLAMSSAGFARADLASWEGQVRDASGRSLKGAIVRLVTQPPNTEEPPAERTTDSNGAFSFEKLVSGKYRVRVEWQGRTLVAHGVLALQSGGHSHAWLEVSQTQVTLRTDAPPGANPGQTREVSVEGTGGAELSGQQVSSLPLNKRDFTRLLALAAGTTTDTNGAANFTQQFAINGQRGTTAVFAIDGADTTDPEIGGATFSNFNVDAIQEIRSDTGVMPASVGEGAAGFTNVITKSGTADVHGSAFEFVRNAAFDARNFFDRRSLAQPGRIPPFVRNEFGLTNGGPVILPGLYDGRGRTFYFGQYGGFRQVLGTTQVFPVPTRAERQGIDTTTFPGDTVAVPISPSIAPVLARYPLPNDPEGAYGARTYAASSKVSTSSDQFSIRLDHRISDQAQLFVRFNFNNVSGPTVNPDQTAIDPTFARRFLDHQRDIALTYTRTVSPNFTSESLVGFVRSTPLFTTLNRVQPGLGFADNLFEPFNSASGGNYGDWGNVFQARQSFTWTRGGHTVKMGIEARINRDTTIFSLSTNGSYTFGGGTAYSSVTIPSASGRHDIHPGDPLPDSLTGFLTGTPYSFTASVAGGPQFPQGNHIGDAAVQREAYNAYVQDSWKISSRLALNYGLRYEVDTRIHEGHHLTSAPEFVGPDGQAAPYWTPGAQEGFLIDPRPPYPMDWRGLGPRVSIEWRATDNTTLRAAGGITTLLPNLFLDNALTGGFPYVVNPYFSAAPDEPVPFTGSVPVFYLPPVYSSQGALLFGPSSAVPPNTAVDVQRFENDLAARTPGHQIQPLLVFGMARSFPDGYIETYTAGVEHDFADVKFNLSYVGTAGVKLVSVIYPNNFGGANPRFAPFTRFDAAGHVTGGFGPEFLIGTPSHSTFHSVEAGVSKTSSRFGLGFQASYTFSKSLDNASTLQGGFGLGTAPGGVVLQPPPQDPGNLAAEKGPSTFDLTHILSLSFVQVLPFNRLTALAPLGTRLTSGWQLLNISTLTSGPPFTVLSGIQQTGLGSGGADRPDQIGQPAFSTSRTVREDDFGLGANNASFFFIPIDLPGGTGPNRGRFGTLGRNTLRGPGFHNFDFALMKDTPLAARGNSEPLTLEFRAEFFNAFNLVNFGLPANVLRGSGFGLISQTAGTSRQLQFSLKLLY
ncbi:MAG TPA: TonB-dependent receptor [Terriglobia bacterium]|nr:TonB-dependent receptor [Terriglobia bacterium]